MILLKLYAILLFTMPTSKKILLRVIHNTLDDEGGADHLDKTEPYCANEGGRYVMPAIRDKIGHAIEIEELSPITMTLPEDPGDPKAKYLGTIVKAASEGINQVYSACQQGHKILSLGGNHVRALDVLGAMRVCHEKGIPFGLIWIDQHLDFNTPETSPTGNIHGMVSAVLQGRGAKELLDLLGSNSFVQPSNIIYIGVREDQIDGHDTKDAEGNSAPGTEASHFASLLKKGAQCFFADSMRVEGLQPYFVSDEAKKAVQDLSERIKKAGGKLWCEWDVDVVDSEDMPAAVMKNLPVKIVRKGTEVEVGGGLSAAQMRDLFNFMEQNCEVDGMGIAEICPDKDIDQKSKRLVAEGVAKVLGLRGFSISCIR